MAAQRGKHKLNVPYSVCIRRHVTASSHDITLTESQIFMVKGFKP